MIVMIIVAILVMVGVPAMSEFVADQRVRTTASDLMAEIAFARAKSIESSRRVYIERTGATWSNGWRIFIDADSSGGFNGGDQVLKVFNGFTPGNMYVCSTDAAFADNMIFRPDGRIVRATGDANNDGIFVVDTLGDANVGNNKIRGLVFGVSGRATAVKMNGAAPPC